MFIGVTVTNTTLHTPGVWAFGNGCETLASATNFTWGSCFENNRLCKKAKTDSSTFIIATWFDWLGKKKSKISKKRNK